MTVYTIVYTSKQVCSSVQISHNLNTSFDYRIFIIAIKNVKEIVKMRLKIGIREVNWELGPGLVQGISNSKLGLDLGSGVGFRDCD